VVVTEDILSAIRVGAHIPAVSILGTKTSDAQAAQLAEYDKVDYWLDPDQAGIDGTVKGRRKLALVTETGAITSPVDPKNLSDREIREALKLTPNHRYTYYDYRDS
jgi:DNA primase